MDIDLFKSNNEQNGNNTVLLYHGSTGGIIGDIKPKSREHCDFGSGFYMGTEMIQPLMLICNFPDTKLYTVEMDLSGLKILDIAVDIDWALLIAYHRRKLKHDNSIYQKYAQMISGYDLVIGYIANDRMFTVLDRFFSGDITDVALVKSLSALKLGKQYVAVTDKACQQIRVLDERSLSEDECAQLRMDSEIHRQEGIRQADEICRVHRRDGRFFDEITDEDMR